MSDEKPVQEKEPSTKNKIFGYLPFIIAVILIFNLIYFSSQYDDYDKFIDSAKGTSETPYLYLPNKSAEEYCLNVDVRDQDPVTLCSKDISRLEKYSECYYHKTGLTGGHVKELVATGMMYKIGSANQISDARAADLAKGQMCMKYYGKDIYEKDRKTVEKDISDILKGKEKAESLSVSYKCFDEFMKNNTTSQCKKSEINKIENIGKDITDNNYDSNEKINKQEVEQSSPEEEYYSQWSCNCSKAVVIARDKCKLNDEKCYDEIGQKYCTDCDIP